ncbi:hypothetical protein TeGR_g12031, partial [Tetraparma gracilis]
PPPPNLALIVSSANAGSTGAQTFSLTLSGISSGGERLASEAVELAGRFPNLTHLSFVGCSMGGLFAREAARLLFSPSSTPLLPPGVQPHSFITLATPHLGVYGTSAGPKARFFSLFAPPPYKGPSELLLSSPALPSLASGGGGALRRFRRRVAYAPLRDDGTVAYRTAALSLAAAVPPAAGGTIARAGPPDPREALAWPGMDPARGKSLVIARMRRDLVEGAPWTVVDVDMRHNQLATLYPTYGGRKPGRNEESFAVAEDVLRRLR